MGRRQRTDLALLYDCIEPSLGEREFSRKAISWALREYAKCNPGAIRRYLEVQGDRLSPLSRREALKGLAWVARHGVKRPKGA